MATPHGGVIETSSGDLLRAGYCDFENDGKLSGSETSRTDVPHPPHIRGGEGLAQMHRWDGAAWVLVDQP